MAAQRPHLHFAFLAASAFLFFAISTIPITGKAEPSFIPLVLAAPAISEVGIALVFRARTLKSAAEQVLRSPADTAILAKWQSAIANLLSFVFAVTVVLYG